MIQFSCCKALICTSPPLLPDELPLHHLLPPEPPSRKPAFPRAPSQYPSEQDPLTSKDSLDSSPKVMDTSRTTPKPVQIKVEEDSQISFARSKEGARKSEFNLTMRNPREETFGGTNSKFARRSWESPSPRKFNPKQTDTPNRLLSIKIQECYTKIDEMKLKLNSLQQANYALTTQLTQSKERLRAKEQECSHTREKYEQLLPVYERSKAQDTIRVRLEREKEELKRLITSSQTERQGLREQLGRHEIKNADSLRLLQLLNENITKREQKLTKDLAEQVLNYQQLNALYEKAQEELGETKREIGSAQQRQRVANAEQHHHSQTLHQLRTQLKAAQQYAQTQTDDILRLNQLIQSQNASLDAQCKAEMAALKSELASERAADLLRQEEYLRTKVQNDDQITSLKRIAQEDKNTMENLKKQIRVKESLISTQNDQITKLNDQITKLNDKITKLNEKQRQLREEVQERQNRIDSAEQGNKQLASELKLRSSELEGVKDGLEQVNEQKRVALREKEELIQKLSSAARRSEMVGQQLTQSREKIKAVAQALEGCQKDLMEQGTAREQLVQQKSVLERQVERLTKVGQENEELLRRIQLGERSLYELECKLRKYEQILQLYKEEIEKMKGGKDREWEQMKEVYQGQIRLLENKIHEILRREARSTTENSYADSNSFLVSSHTRQ